MTTTENTTWTIFLPTGEIIVNNGETAIDALTNEGYDHDHAENLVNEYYKNPAGYNTPGDFLSMVFPRDAREEFHWDENSRYWLPNRNN